MKVSETKPGSASLRNKRPYHSPRLVVYGDLRRLTKAKGGSKNDSGAPKTKV